MAGVPDPPRTPLIILEQALRHAKVVLGSCCNSRRRWSVIGWQLSGCPAGRTLAEAEAAGDTVRVEGLTAALEACREIVRGAVGQ